MTLVAPHWDFSFANADTTSIAATTSKHRSHREGVPDLVSTTPTISDTSMATEASFLQQYRLPDESDNPDSPDSPDRPELGGPLWIASTDP